MKLRQLALVTVVVILTWVALQTADRYMGQWPTLVDLAAGASTLR